MNKRALLASLGVLVVVVGFSGCRLYYNDARENIPDNPEEVGVSEIEVVMRQPTVVQDLDVEIGIEHPDLSELEAWLESPQGTTVPLFSDIRGVGLNTVIFDDEAAYPVYPFDYPYGPWGGTVQIQEYNPRTTGLFLVDGEDASGAWKLHVRDRVPGNVGKITFFALCINGVW